MTEKELMLTSVLGLERSQLYMKNIALDEGQKNRLNYIIEQRKNGQPLQYLLGFAEFMGIKLKIDKRALIPRPETEILVEETINAIKGSGIEIKNVLDIGTGSGNIAISIAKFFPHARIAAVDISKEALDLARENAVLNEVDERIDFIIGDFANNKFLCAKSPIFNLIISNPPYIKTSDLNTLPKDVLEEPKIALDAGKDGLKFYRAIIQKSPALIKKQGLLSLEIGYNQGEAIIQMLQQDNKFEVLKVIKDYNDFERVIISRLS